MNTDVLFDPLFAEPFATGLTFAILLPLLGCYLRLRDEWLAALAFAQTAAAGSLLAMLFGLPLALGGLAAGGLAACPPPPALPPPVTPLSAPGDRGATAAAARAPRAVTAKSQYRHLRTQKGRWM